MPDPRIEPSFEAPRAGTPDKRARMALILKLVKEAPAALNAEQANALLDESFREIESDVPSQDDRMGVEPFRLLRKTEHGGKTIYCSEAYRSHTVYLGENGAIEIRRGDRVEFEKPGADGLGVWDPAAASERKSPTAEME